MGNKLGMSLGTGELGASVTTAIVGSVVGDSVSATDGAGEGSDVGTKGQNSRKGGARSLYIVSENKSAKFMFGRGYNV